MNYTKKLPIIREEMAMETKAAEKSRAKLRNRLLAIALVLILVGSYLG